MEDFIQRAALFSDLFVACGMKIVLSGTDSLFFYLQKMSSFMIGVSCCV